MSVAKAGFGLLAALLFGVSTPLAKVALQGIDPLMLAGLLYLGSGVGLMICMAFLGNASFKQLRRLGRRELAFLAGAIVVGGMVAPVLLLLGLRLVDSSTASLLLNLEGALTALIACLVFHESYGKRLRIGLVFILAGGFILSAREL